MGDQATQDEGYTEIEVRWAYADSRKYYNALFPQGPRGEKAKKEEGKGKEKEMEKEGKKERYPAFGTKSWPAPIHLKEEEFEQAISDDSEEEDNTPSYRKFKKRHHYIARKETQWVLTDKKRKHVLHGKAEGQTAAYYVMIPPPQSRPEDPFRVVRVHEWLSFKPPPNYKPLSGKEAKAMQESKTSLNKVVKYMEKRQKKIDEEMDLAGVRDENSSRRAKQSTEGEGEGVGYSVDLDNPDDLLNSDDDAETKAKSKGKRGKTSDIANDVDDDDQEKDITVMAIDRTDFNGEGNGDADFEEEFQDDEDDGQLLQEQEQIINNEDQLIQGAEEVREALTDEEGNETEDSEDEEEGIEEYQQNLEALLERRKNRTDDDDDEDDLERQRFLNSTYYKTKVVKEAPDAGSENGATPAVPGKDDNNPDKTSSSSTDAAGTKRPIDSSGQSSSSGAPPRKKAKTPIALFKESVIEAIRQSGNNIEIGKLMKVVTKKKVLKKAGMKKAEAQQALLHVVKEIANIKEDNIDGKMRATLKPAYV
uniref:Transcription initiation factor IIF subunit alpha n=1 Tax=Mucochytrium quahogii TaxID=96639 RepID=A0A7S2S5F6_9STRA|mmetsp:Transcript_889/g.963  ORF Transcript_889/g.963 Transcript_889/m.963 type:complete len:534 (-) Transcript_889:609-2210(-)|eukprot:CAMPEP_0203751242 /NCGR_PEP_ID=MMETSP0098-20131031/5341_1 /ASSEMBLY_ACC=CAM_ASM_000208 /TAXON_ID=96639 /ORGANISM=" , Strain NY0313808BC1" /LENGTH=533 /DNA_ID=CAMNT_0050640867 /DNA_START=310 /DNA_END=1911 /DNA_ORIENTATION=+